MVIREEAHGLSRNLIDWYSREKRDLPWRNTQDPYRIWLSEIILQQTRVAQGLPYYHNFVAQYPSVFELANAPEDRVLRTWQGLGYYSRARNLHKTAKIIAQELGGEFPDNYADLLKLPGVGPYTAAAIASLAFGEPVPVLDGNVFRLISRLFGLEYDIANAANRKYFMEVLETLISQEVPGSFNQATMEMGALVCTPRNPKCDQCPVNMSCFAFKHRKQDQLPVKIKKIRIRSRTFHYVIFEYNGKLGLKQRQGKDIWQGLYEFQLFEGQPFSIQEDWGNDIDHLSGFKHVLTHQRIDADFYLVRCVNADNFEKQLNKYGLTAFTHAQMLILPKPKLLVNYIEQQNF